MTEIIDLETIGQSDVAKVLNAWRKGMVVAYPTDTIYGLGVDAFNRKAVQNLLRLKRRKGGKPTSVLYADTPAILNDFEHLNDYQQKAVQALLPGKITLILPTHPKCRFPEEITSNGTIGVRATDMELLNRILRQYPYPITTTSINPPEAPPARNIAEILSYFGDQISLILTCEQATGSLPSTLVKVGKSSLEIIRAGAVNSVEIEEKMKKL